MELTIHPSAYLNWQGCTEPVDVKAALKKDFELKDRDTGAFVILAALYDYSNYHGYAFVLLWDAAAGALFEVNAEHCSCTGLEGRWAPEPVNFSALQMRNSFAYCDDAKVREAILEAAWVVTGGDCPQGAA